MTRNTSKGYLPPIPTALDDNYHQRMTSPSRAVPDSPAARDPGDVPDVNWLDEREYRAWRGFHDLRIHLIGYLSSRLMAESGLSSADFEVLVTVSEAPDRRLRAVDLGRTLGWEKSRLSHQVTRMERRGLVQREDHPGSKRSTDVVLTEAGYEAISAAAPLQLVQVRRAFIDLLTPEQLDTLADIAQVVVANLEQIDDGLLSDG